MKRHPDETLAGVLIQMFWEMMGKLVDRKRKPANLRDKTAQQFTESKQNMFNPAHTADAEHPVTQRIPGTGPKTFNEDVGELLLMMVNYMKQVKALASQVEDKTVMQTISVHEMEIMLSKFHTDYARHSVRLANVEQDIQQIARDINSIRKILQDIYEPSNGR